MRIGASVSYVTHSRDFSSFKISSDPNRSTSSAKQRLVNLFSFMPLLWFLVIASSTIETIKQTLKLAFQFIGLPSSFLCETDGFSLFELIAATFTQGTKCSAFVHSILPPIAFKGQYTCNVYLGERLLKPGSVPTIRKKRDHQKNITLE